MLFYGPSGAGKKTRLTAVLREIFGPAVDKASTSFCFHSHNINANSSFVP
jgi:DNA polymerase III delta prime subunit